MSRIQRIRRRRASDSLANHDRARRLAAERLDGSLEPVEATWLREHLAGCASCRAVSAAYEADRMALRGLRERTPEPPRDLWARTSAAIEREAASRGGRPRRSSSGRPRPALGVLSGVAVIAVVIGASVMSGGWLNSPTTVAPAATPPPVALGSPNGGPGPTPIAVGAGSVGWVGTSTDGQLAYNVTSVDQVCPVERKPDCAEVSDGHSRQVALTIRPKSISQSPVRNQAVVVGSDGSGNDAVVVIALPTVEPTATPAPTPTPATASTPPSGKPTKTADPTAETSEPPSSEPPSSEPTSSEPPSSEPPSSQTPEPTPSPTPKPTASPTPVPATATATALPTPTLAANLAIVSGVRVVGQSAAYSPDGDWFAFTARPSDGSTGPDIYVWRVGDDLARSVTDDHASVFGSWAGSRIIGSRPAAEGSADVTAASFIIDPETGKETALKAPVWRPVVDPNDDWAVVWDGTVRIDPTTRIPVPDKGSLVLRGYSKADGVALNGPTGAITDGDVSEFDVRWDETGTWLAIWIADSSDPSIGRLSLLRIDPVSGEVDRPHGAPQDVTALPGFSIADGRLAWATPPGQGGDSSRVQIVAWTDEAVGSVESGPITDVVVIH